VRVRFWRSGFCSCCWRFWLLLLLLLLRLLLLLCFVRVHLCNPKLSLI
jgi:hypothetical protein